MKKTISALLAVILLISTLLCVPAGAASVSDFTDVKPTAWYYNAVDYAVGHGLFNGTGKTTFSPNTAMTRGMFVTVLGNLHGIDKAYGQDRTSPFADVKKSDYFYAASVWAKDNGIASGTGSGFSPSGNVTREQMAVMLYNYFLSFSGLTLADKETTYYTFPDNGKVSGYARPAMQWAVKYGVISGSDGQLAPQGKATRAQVAQVLLNFSKLDQFAASEPTSSPEPTASPEPSSTPEPTARPELTWKDWPLRPMDWDEGSNREIWKKVADEWFEVRAHYSENIRYDIPTGQSEPDEDGGYYDYDLSNEIMRQINELRAEYGREPLLYNPRVQGWSDIRAKECSILFDHTRPDGSFCLSVDGMSSEYSRWALDAENIAVRADNIGLYGDSVESAARGFAQAWFNSSGHRQNMLSGSLQTAAVSCYVKDGKVYSCHLFSDQTQFYIDWEYPFEIGTNDPYDP